jgi:outer membrane protein assembly factor BamB
VKAGCTLSPSEKYVAFGSFNKQFVVLDTKTGKEVRVFETREGNYSTPAWHGEDVLVATSLDKQIYAFDVEKGGTRWAHPTSARIFASPVIFDGKVFCGNNSARLYVLDLKTGHEVALFQATERITNAVTIDEKHDRLYVPTFANEVFALHPLHLPPTATT